MPGLYGENEYDMAGFCVGIVDRDRIIDGSKIGEGDKIIGIPSSGLHSNGFSLARKVLLERAGLGVNDIVEELGCSVGDALLTPTRIYTKQVQQILGHTQPKGFVHITGGGFFENIPRIMPAGLGARIEKDAWKRPPIFDLIKKLGDIEEKEMFSTFNMGIGLMAVVEAAVAGPVIELLAAAGEEASIIGEVSLGTGVTLW
jgi:phosphoribosylformylglycinamidine cyclo-ligase